jgi:hypothetical protein
MGLPMPPWVTMMTLAPRIWRRGRWRDRKTEPTPGVTGAFAEDEVLFPGDAVEGIFDAGDEGVVVGAFEVAPGEIRFDGDGAHIDQGTIELVDLVHEDRVLIDLLFLDFDEALADRFDVADAG